MRKRPAKPPAPDEAVRRSATDYAAALGLDRLPPLVPAIDAARALCISRQKVCRLVEEGELAAVRLGRAGLRIYRDSLVDLVRRGGTL